MANADCFPAFSKDALLWHLKQKGKHVPCAFQHVSGQDWWKYLRSDPAIEETFAKAMKCGDVLGMYPILFIIKLHILDLESFSRHWKPG